MSQLGDSNNMVINAYDGVINWLRQLVSAVRANLVLFAICIFAAIALVFLYNRGKTEKYTASFTVSYDDLVRKIYGDRLYKINRLIKQREYDKIAGYLSIDQKTAASLVEIKGKNILGENLTEDMNTDRIPFIINFTVKDTSTVHKIQTGIVNFLEEGNTYSARNKELKAKEIEDEIAFVDRQLDMMDSLKRKYNAGIASSDEKSNSLTTIYNFSYELYKIRKDLLKKRTMPGNIHVIDDAIAAEATGWPTIVVLLLGIIGGILLFIFMILFVKPVFSRR